MPGIRTHRNRMLRSTMLISMLLLFCTVSAMHANSVSLAGRKFTITATAGNGGSISPSGKVRVKRGKSKTFTISANEGYEISDVVVDGVSIGPVTSYKFSKVRSDHTISANFSLIMYTITASAGTGGKVSPSGEVQVAYGDHKTFAISAGAGYEISDVVVDGISMGPLTGYKFQEVTADHTIRALFKQKVIRIHGVTIPNESMKTGDVITATITVDDDDGVPYSLISGSVGGYPLEGFQRITATTYYATFTIREGGNSFTASQDIPVSNLVITDGAVLSAPYHLPIEQDGDPIDARAPVVTRLEVPSVEVGVGGTVKVRVTADGTGYSAGTGTVINGVPLNSSQVTFTEVAGGVYEISYRVETGDQDVAPGDLQMRMVMRDPAGNTGKSYETIETNLLEIYTALPEAVIGGTSDICEGEEVELNLFLTGRPPWSFELSDGTHTILYQNISSAEKNIPVTPVRTTTYRINTVTDVNGVENTGTGSVVVSVHEKSEVKIINLASGYSITADPVRLEANLTGGTFSGPGVVSATGYFYPGIADTVNSPHTIYYTYTSDYGCESVASKQVYVLVGEASILLPADPVCKNAPPFAVSVYNVTSENGSFRLLNSASQPVSALTDHGDNSATIDPSLLNVGNYTVEYRFTDMETRYIRKTFSVDSVEQPRFLSLSETTYCQSASPVELQSSVANALFEGPGVSGNIHDGYIFDSRDTDPGNITITCTAVSENGCTASTGKSLLILEAPKVKFSINTACIPEGGDVVSFDNQSLKKSSVSAWNWDFGDPSSGMDNYSDLVNPTHFYREQGQKTISLTATTQEGCEDAYTLDTLIDSRSVADFTWLSECHSSESGIRFVNRSKYGSSAIDTVIWRFRNSDSLLLDEIGARAPADTVTFTFASAGRYLVGLYTSTSGGCASQSTKEIVLRPTIHLDGEGYQENFDLRNEMWTIHSNDGIASWVWDEPDFTGYNPVPGDKAWLTRLPPETTGYREYSWIQSPCFDFTGMKRPMIRMDILRSFIPGISGAVLQYQDVAEEGWKTVGENDPGIGWYNLDSIFLQPGGSHTGWGLDRFAPDTAWITAMHHLDPVAGNPNVALRVAFATGGDQVMENQGFAFDNVAITERSKLTVLEHFTNSSGDTSRLADHIIDSLGKTYPADVIDLQYHMNYPGPDPMSYNNPDPATTRSFNYGVPRVPYTVLGGGVGNDYRYDFPDLKQNPVGDQVRLLTLEHPAFDIDLSVDWLDSRLEATTAVTCRKKRFENNIQLYLVVFETSVTAYTGRNGDTHFRNVVLDMLPTPAGRLLGDSWFQGDSVVRTNSWNYADYVEDPGELAVAAFIQDRNTGKILQAAVAHMNETVGVLSHSVEKGKLRCYPNPAIGTLYVHTGSMNGLGGRIDLLDMNGRVVLQEEVPAGYQLIRLDIAYLNRGLYILRWVESGQVRAVTKIVITR